MGKKRTSDTFSWSQSNHQNSRVRRNHRVVEHQVSYEEKEANGHSSNKESSSTDERSTKVKSKEDKTFGSPQTSLSSSEANAHMGSDDNDSETNRELLGIIMKTRTVMECLHRFCMECIDKSMRLGNNECHACRTHCASCRSLRYDPNYDSLIVALYPDVDKYEEEGNHRVVEHQVSYEEEEANGHGSTKDPSSTDGRSTKVKSKQDKTLGGALTSQPSSKANAHVGSDDNDLEINRELHGAVSGFIDYSKVSAWESGGMSSDTHQCSPCEATDELSKNNGVSELTETLLSACENDLAANTKQ
ncbi:hypothetical protein RD792_007876 [Penstemon davidsonii]|uniref:Zinc finger C3HC4 RING-type domain-containing protein n=1 Tax=Penstemon davidsonii TaxID=160366 RepID=A0ABR0D8W8_9LAMI|nr:hypothetical protein RD792_007876 [Penstemon davidsonii]